MKKIFALSVALFSFMTLTAFANSAPTYWRGSEVTGIVTGDKDCPVVVEKEVLTFDIGSFPTEYHGDTGQFTGAKFTAQYTLHNPTDMDITTDVLFPFGLKGDYYSADYMTDKDFAQENYCVYLDGEKINSQIRYTFAPSRYENFDVDKQISQISDIFNGGFFHPDQRVTRYVINCGVRDEEKSVSINWTNTDNSTYLYTNDFRSGRFNENTASLTTDFYGEIVYYTIGGDNKPEVKIIKKDDLNFSQSADEITTSQEMTLKEFVTDYLYTGFDSTEISDVDLDNVISAIFSDITQGDENRAFLERLTYYNIPADLMGWYKYEITIPAGGTVVNTVSAPLYPDVNTRYEPPVYTYNYLLSPAGKWADFKGLEILVNTPFYMTETSIENFEKTEAGYKSTFDKLPEGDFVMSLSESEKPKVERNYGYLAMFIPILAMPLAAVVILVLIIKFAIKKKNK